MAIFARLDARLAAALYTTMPLKYTINVRTPNTAVPPVRHASEILVNKTLDLSLHIYPVNDQNPGMQSLLSETYGL